VILAAIEVIAAHMAPFSPTMEPLQTQGGSVDEVDVRLLDGSKEALQKR
jgi:hypothetical protein